MYPERIAPVARGLLLILAGLSFVGMWGANLSARAELAGMSAAVLTTCFAVFLSAWAVCYAVAAAALRIVEELRLRTLHAVELK